MKKYLPNIFLASILTLGVLGASNSRWCSNLVKKTTSERDMVQEASTNLEAYLPYTLSSSNQNQDLEQDESWKFPERYLGYERARNRIKEYKEMFFTLENYKRRMQVENRIDPENLQRIRLLQIDLIRSIMENEEIMYGKKFTIEFEPEDTKKDSKNSNTQTNKSKEAKI
jgi:hypothetical protein